MTGREARMDRRADSELTPSERQRSGMLAVARTVLLSPDAPSPPLMRSFLGHAYGWVHAESFVQRLSLGSGPQRDGAVEQWRGYA